MSTPAIDEPVLEGAGLYLLHFEPAYRHARHYLGYADDIPRRIGEHLRSTSRSSPLVRAAIAAGSLVVVARTFPGCDRTEERRMKRNHGHARFCPICRSRST